MEESTNKIIQYDSCLNSKIEEIIELFDQTSKSKTYSLSKIDNTLMSKIDNTLMRTIEDAQDIKEKYKSMIYFNYY